LKIVPLEHDPVKARDYLDDRSLQIGHILPLGDSLLREHFASGSSFLLLKGKATDALFSYLGEGQARTHCEVSSCNGLLVGPQRGN
jgi:hypothetical protein